MFLKKHKPRSFSLYYLVYLFFISFFPLANAKQVKIDKVTSWHKGEQVLLYCVVAVPFKNQVSSYAEAELLWVLPEGSWVEIGDVLARQDNFQLERKSNILAINIADAKSKQDFTHKEYSRLIKLSNGHASESELNDLKRQYEQAKYALANLEQQRKLINYRISRLEHRAPFAGIVSDLTANLGANMAIGQPILQLIPTQSKELLCNISLDIYQQFKIYNNKDLSSVRFNFNEHHSLTFKRHKASANKAQQSITVFLSLPTELQTKFVIGKRLQVTMHQEVDKVTQVPFDAMILENDGNYVWAVDEHNKVQKQAVTIVSTKADSFIVRSQLKVGTRVVVRGKHSLEAGTNVFLLADNL